METGLLVDIRPSGISLYLKIIIGEAKGSKNQQLQDILFNNFVKGYMTLLVSWYHWVADPVRNTL